ncbi:DUF917 domain-containing protein [Pseudonocardia kunmingensis]|uniref:DUF917 domain-containing protein n=1 Tax=Pseudonocardia kunmingensis TaxID=630975 RepID=A0A543DVU5_9PSEU|nr:DUF917 domain-containing protein [Pseudonocardia kunmingensis]TQM13450.1 hypothetical protein FB558_0194 [Pseudonocardia kunmingensis]
MTGTLTTAAITADDLEALARGAAVLGTGGGGDPYIGRLLAAQALREHGPVALVAPSDLPDDAQVFPVAMMGAPTVMVEKTPSVERIGDTVAALARHIGVTPTHIACIEAGGVNSTFPLVAAAQLGLPVVDGDGMGRAFPELQMVLQTLSGIGCTPMSIADEKGNVGVLQSVDNRSAEALARSLTITMGCAAIISNYAMTGAQARASLVAGTLSLCTRIGRRVAEVRAEHGDAVGAVAAELGGRVLHSGKVTDVARRTTTGFARGTAVVSGAGELVLEFQNEHLVARRDGVVEVTTPDLIIVLDTDSGEPVTTEALRFGHRVSVLAAPADERWHSPGGIELVGPRYFGYDTDPVRFDAREDR